MWQIDGQNLQPLLFVSLLILHLAAIVRPKKQLDSEQIM